MDLNEQESRLSGRLKLTSTAEESLPSTSLMQSGLETYGSVEAITSSPLTSSAEGSPARMCLLPARDGVSKATQEADSGVKCGELLASYDRESSSWRTRQVCLPLFMTGQEQSSQPQLAEFWETWPSLGMTQRGESFRLVNLEPHIHENGCSLWPTPNAGMYRSIGYEISRLRKRAEKHQIDLVMALQLSADGGRANPNWIEWAMGFPAKWTEFTPSEMPLSRKLQSGSAEGSSKRRVKASSTVAVANVPRGT